MLELSAEITRLEHQLYPADNRVSVFLSLVDVPGLILESMQLSVNGSLANTHIYSAEHNRALQGGGIQKMFEGVVAASVSF